MNALAKVLVVLVLVLSVGFAASQIVLYGYREDFAEKYAAEARARTDAQSKLADTQAELNDARRRADDLKERSETEILTLKASLENEKTRSMDLSRQVDQANALSQSLSADVKSLNERLTVRDQTVEELRATVSNRDQSIRQDLDKVELLQKTVAEKDGTISDLEAQLTELKKAHKELAESEARLQTTIAELVQRGIQVPPAPLPIIDGRVVLVDEEHRLAVVDRGETAGVKPNTQFTVYDEGGYVAKLVIHDVQPEVAAGQIRLAAEGRTVKQGDRVTTKIP